MALRYEKRLLQKSEINLGREGTAQAANFPELRNEIVALKKLEQEQKEVALRIAQIEEGIKKIEEERQQNTRDQHAAIAKLDAEKKPLLQQHNQAKNAVDICERELATVGRRIQENEAADRDLLKQLSDLHAIDPPPSDLEARSANISARRARLPEERAELVRARLGSADAARLAKEKLIAAAAELSIVEKNIERVRSEFEGRDRKFNDNIRAQEEALREARAQHQTVEERKNPAYLNIGRHLAAQGIAPPNAAHLLTETHRHREAMERHLQHRAELALLSSQIDKQELRKFYFSVFSVLAARHHHVVRVFSIAEAARMVAATDRDHFVDQYRSVRTGGSPEALAQQATRSLAENLARPHRRCHIDSGIKIAWRRGAHHSRRSDRRI